MGARQSTTNSPSRMVHGANEDNNSSSYSPFTRNNHEQTLSNNNDNNGREWLRARSLTSSFLATGDPTTSQNNNNNNNRQRSTQLSNAIDFSSTSSSSSHDILNYLSDDREFSSITFTPHSLPIRFLPYMNHLKCPFCSKIVLHDDMECHFVECITRPQLIYNEDILTEDKGECVICLDEMLKGNKIARLPCLCIYHKVCIDAWFNVNRSCPEHPID